MRKLALAAALTLAACHDSGEEIFQQAHQQYAKLLNAGTPVQSPEFDAVLQQLRSVPEKSASSVQAKKIIGAIEAARGGNVRAPLAAHVCEGIGAGLDPARQREALEQCRRRALQHHDGDAE